MIYIIIRQNYIPNICKDFYLHSLCAITIDNIDKWTSVREEWNRVYSRNNNLKLKESFDNRKLYEYLLFSDDYDSPSTHKKLINSFIIN